MVKQNLIVTLSVEELESLIKRAINSIFEGSPWKEPRAKSKNAKLISRKQAARIFDISLTSFDKWRHSGILPPEIKVASRVYYNLDEIEQFLEDRKRKNPNRNE